VPGARSYNAADMIDRDQVLHIARLARLRLGEDEVERMAQELSGILEHVETIGSLDLEGIEPTTHVVALENVMRADVPAPSLDRDRALAGAPDSSAGAFRVPSPQA
jgi:aspartyl-tRNA(Asn)/glutamyl-tRNA(Gln) amidotransferase subunit C